MNRKKETVSEALYDCIVMHRRAQPFVHELRYKVFCLLLDIDDLKNIKRKTKFLSFNKWNLLSFYNKDHGARDGSDIRPWLEDLALQFKKNIQQHKIYCLCFPRILGYVFNPLTVYYCYHPKTYQIDCVFYEVKNTFGEQHIYFSKSVTPDKNNIIKHEKKKIFHVSPFIEMDCIYNFSIKAPDEKLYLTIDQKLHDNSKMLFASWTGKRKKLNAKTLIKSFFNFPFMTLKIIFAIHWHALLLWIKGATYYKKPSPPKERVS